MSQYECSIYGWIYDEEKGDPETEATGRRREAKEGHETDNRGFIGIPRNE